MTSSDVSCSAWPEPQVQGYGCAGLGIARRKELDAWMYSTDWASCQRLCTRERENGCCYLNTGAGCFWVPGGSSGTLDRDISVSVNCNRAG